MEKKDKENKVSRDLIKLLTKKIDKCNWEKISKNYFSNQNNSSTMYGLEYKGIGSIYIDMKILYIYDRADQLILINEPTAEEAHAYNHAILWSEIHKKISTSTEQVLQSILNELNSI